MDTKCRCSERDSSIPWKGTELYWFYKSPSARWDSFFNKVWYKKIQISNMMSRIWC